MRFPVKVFDSEKFEGVLLKSWSDFMEKPKLIAFVLKCVRDHADLNHVEGEPPVRGMQFIVSRFLPREGYFDVYVEYTCPTADGTAVGTCETRLGWDGVMEHVRTVGVLFGS
jgi:hypothetical protein